MANKSSFDFVFVRFSLATRDFIRYYGSLILANTPGRAIVTLYTFASGLAQCERIRTVSIVFAHTVCHTVNIAYQSLFPLIIAMIGIQNKIFKTYELYCPVNLAWIFEIQKSLAHAMYCCSCCGSLSLLQSVMMLTFNTSAQCALYFDCSFCFSHISTQHNTTKIQYNKTWVYNITQYIDMCGNYESRARAKPGCKFGFLLLRQQHQQQQQHQYSVNRLNRREHKQ